MSASDPARPPAPSSAPGLVGMSLAALGVVYGDIGTSPLYAVQAAFGEAGGLPVAKGAVFGVLSLIFWSLVVVVSFKYVGLIMRADNRGEGGILALSALVQRTLRDRAGQATAIALATLGAALFYGDGVITPAISVLSAVEGLHVATPVVDRLVLPLAVVILVGLFLFQHHGTDRVGRLFGPVMVVWFVVSGLLGLASVAVTPQVLGALSPVHAIRFMTTYRWAAFVALGAVVLAVTGSEALYADMGHFGRRPIRLAWFGLVLPSLVLNYFGQGALLLRQPDAAANPFFFLVPSWAQLPMVALATAATVIASQAVISGAFSISRQAIQLGFLPRMEVRHTSEHEAGQVYVPQINWVLMVAVILLVLGFGSSARLAAAYGIAVTGTMAITVILARVVAREQWRWPLPATLAVFVPLLLVDLGYFSANSLKIAEGGWFPIVLAVLVYVLMSTWRTGRSAVFRRLYLKSVPLDTFVRDTARGPIHRVPGVAVFLSGRVGVAPRSLLQNIEHNHVLHERNVIVTVETADIPRVDPTGRMIATHWGEDIHSVRLRYGFMEHPNVPEALMECGLLRRELAMMDTSFFLSRTTLVPSDEPDLPPWREGIFIFLSHEAVPATEFLCLPHDRVIELGVQLRI